MMKTLMRQPVQRLVRSGIALAAVCAVAVPASADFSLGGYTPQVVQSETGLTGSAVSFQTTRTWSISGWDPALQDFKTVNVDFTIPPNQAVPFARLYLDVYGGNKLYTAQVAVTVNGTAMPTVSIGGADSQGNSLDTNPTFDASQTCVYGSSIGQWQLALAGVAGLLRADGTPNAVTVRVSDPDNTGFDGRMVDVSLMAVYQDPSINQKLDYFLAEGDGYMRTPPPNAFYGNAPAERTIAFSGLDTANVTAATYTTLYTHGDLNQADRLLFNGVQLGNNDVAHAQYGQYGPDFPAFDVTGNLASALNVVYDVNAVGGVSGETSLLAKIGLLTVTHPAPAGQSVWTATTGGDWGDANNWNNGVPQRAGDTATFAGSIGSASATVSLNGNREISGLTFNNPQGGDYTIAQGSGGVLILSNSGNPVPVAVSDNGGHHVIGVQVDLLDNLAVSVGAGTGASLAISGKITGTGKSLVKSGAGTLTLSAVNNDYSGGTVVSSGTLIFSTVGALPAGSNLSIGTGGTAVLASSLSAASGTGSDTILSDASSGLVPEPPTALLFAAAALTALLAYHGRRGMARHSRTKPEFVASHES
jgi:autotransporter-associated beta strand protein